VIVSRESDTHRLRAIVANSGGSNTGDGQRGIDTARATQQRAAELLGIDPGQVGLASTGVIGTALPREPLLDGTAAAIAELGNDTEDFSRAILTSDVGPKRACLEVALPSGATVRIAGQVKGAGMISPRYATMFCFIETDAAMSAETIELLTTVTVKRSFDRISVDGQLSTSDTVFVLANGRSGVAIEPESDDELKFGEAMDALMRQLALKIVSDGEGSRRIGRIVVRGDVERIEPVARAIANSNLVKTALYGGDPNFGRILQAAGMAWAGGDAI
jgi:glutamate N-acetyltransferase/amino-acid N-acetyltransferase